MKTLLAITFALTVLTPCVFSDELTARESTVTAADTQPKIKLIPGDWTSIKRHVRNSEGKVVVVDIWSTSCLPCMREYPNLLKLRQKYGQNIVCLSLNVDYVGIKSRPPKYYEARIRKFLGRQKGSCVNYVCTVESDELFDELKLSSIPAVYVFDKAGKVAKRFDDRLLTAGEEDAFTYEDDINPFVEQLLK